MFIVNGEKLGSIKVDEDADPNADPNAVASEESAAPAEDSTNTEGGYADLTVPELKAEIESRNEGRDGGDLLSTDGKKADLVATLEGDDDGGHQADD